jgi:mRNA-degrading endonuclease RelE of RelBE toxin-antitoxin system
MPFQIVATQAAESHLRWLTVREQRIIESAMAERLCHQPTVETNAIKRLRPNPFAQYELRLGNLRVLYNVNMEGQEVLLVAVGRKVRDKLIVEGKEFHEHR